MLFITVYKPDKEIHGFETDVEAEQFLLDLRRQYLKSCGYGELYRLKQRLANYMHRPDDKKNEYYLNSLERKYNSMKLDLSHINHSLKVIIEK